MIDRTSGRKDCARNLKYLLFGDCYKVQRWPQDCFDYIFDIGAHVGTFSLMMRMRHPHSKIIAVEPGIEQLTYLRANLDYLDVKIIDKAIGDGRQLYFHPRANLLGGTIFAKNPPNSSDKFYHGEKTYLVDSMRFVDIFNQSGCKLEDNFIVKFDCEGGEVSVVKDAESVPILSNAMQISFEIHFNSEGMSHEDWLDYPDYDNWIRNSFHKTHTIEYYMSSKHRGYGHYCITRKDAFERWLKV